MKKIKSENRRSNDQSFSVLEQTACRLAFTHCRSVAEANGVSFGVARTVVRVYDRTTCRSYVSDDLSFG